VLFISYSGMFATFSTTEASLMLRMIESGAVFIAMVLAPWAYALLLRFVSAERR
jgi:hypothetical protein